MSFLTTAPEEVQAATQNLAGIRSTLAEASASAAAPITGVVAAAQDEVSAGVAALFGAFGQDYQAFNAQAQTFHEQFVNLLNSGAGAYLATEVANAEQNLLSAVGGEGVLGQSLGGEAAGTSGAALGAVAAAAQSAALPLLSGGGILGSVLGGSAGGLGSVLGSGTSMTPLLGGLGGGSLASLLGGLGGGPVGQSINGVVTALGTGGVASLLSGPIGGSLQTGQASIGTVTAAATDATGIGAIVGPYESLITNTAANLQSLGNTWTHVTAPALLQAITTQIDAPQRILTALASGNPLSILSQTGQSGSGYANISQQLAVPVSLSLTSLSPSGASFALGIGLPELLALDALGPQLNATTAVTASSAAFFNAMQTGNPVAAAVALIDAPANIANGFLNGEQTLSLSLPLPGLAVTANVPLTGLLVPLQPITGTATVPGLPLLNTVTVTGPPVGGLLPALISYVPELLASAFTT